MSTIDAETALGAAGVPNPDGGQVQGETRRWIGVHEFFRNPQARIGLGIVIFMFLFCFLGPVFYHTNQVAVNINLKDLEPSRQHLLGTDDFGFDMIGRLMRGGQASMALGFAVAGVTTVIGTLYGAIAGIVGGFVDGFMMRIIDTLLAIPGLVLLLILVNIFTPSLIVIIFALSMLSWLGIARLVRGEVLSLRTRDYVLAAKTMGGGTGRIMTRHLVPNAIGVIIVNATFSIADAITGLSTLSFLGLGMSPPYADWGTLLTNGLNDLFDGYWWLVYPPAILLILTIIGFSLIGDVVRDSLDVRLRRR
jgi:peptide/nickel transport system permease protein